MFILFISKKKYTLQKYTLQKLCLKIPFKYCLIEVFFFKLFSFLLYQNFPKRVNSSKTRSRKCSRIQKFLLVYIDKKKKRKSQETQGAQEGGGENKNLFHWVSIESKHVLRLNEFAHYALNGIPSVCKGSKQPKINT